MYVTHSLKQHIFSKQQTHIRVMIPKRMTVLSPLGFLLQFP